MSKKSFVDFKAVKAALSMERVLQHYRLLDGLKKSGDTLSGCCPLHNGSNPTQFRVSLGKNIWNCFGDCKGGGNVLDFVAKKERLTIHQAALKAIEWFHLDGAAKPVSRDHDVPTKEPKESKPTKEPPENTPNPPLKFRLEKLRQDHAYLLERGLNPETITEFGIGFCDKGLMADRIAIPIQNATGEIVAYAGRRIVDSDPDIPKYKFPQGFRKSLELFNIHRAAKAPIGQPLIIVEGFFDCLKLFQLGYRNMVGLMGSSLSEQQESLITAVLKPDRILHAR